MNLFDMINSDEFNGIMRHLLGAAGGATFITGNLDPTQWQTISGALATIAAILWSVANKKYMRGKLQPTQGVTNATPPKA